MSARRSKCDGGNLPKRSRLQSPEPMDMKNRRYRIERVLGRRLAEGNGTSFEYNIKWLDYDEERNTWEPESELQEYRYWLQEFNRAEYYKAELEALKSSMIARNSSEANRDPASYHKALAANKRLIQENKLISSKLRVKEARIGQLEGDLRVVKISRREIQTKLTRMTNDLKETMQECSELKKGEFVTNLSKKDSGMAGFEKTVLNLLTDNDNLREELFQKQERIKSLERDKAIKETGRSRGLQPLNPRTQVEQTKTQSNFKQLQRALQASRLNNWKLTTTVAGLTRENQELMKSLAVKDGRVPTGEHETQSFPTANQHLI